MSIFDTGTLDKFFAQHKCCPEERNLIVIYLAVIRLNEQVKALSHYLDMRFMQDGEGI